MGLHPLSRGPPQLSALPLLHAAWALGPAHHGHLPPLVLLVPPHPILTHLGAPVAPGVLLPPTPFLSLSPRGGPQITVLLESPGTCQPDLLRLRPGEGTLAVLPHWVEVQPPGHQIRLRSCLPGLEHRDSGLERCPQRGSEEVGQDRWQIM